MDMNLPNKLTILRVIMIPVFLVFLLNPWNFMDAQVARYISLGVFVVASLTDMLDGYIARSRNLITNFGKFADPLADKLLVAAAMIALVELGELASWVVIVIICREFIVTGFRLVAVEKNVVIAAGFWGKLKTITQMIMVIFLLIGISGNMIYDIIADILIYASAILTIISGVDYIYKNIGVLKD